MRAPSGLAGALRGTLVVGVAVGRGGEVCLLFAGEGIATRVARAQLPVFGVLAQVFLGALEALGGLAQSK
jgi:hypothetical protein